MTRLDGDCLAEREALTEAQIEELYALACRDWGNATSVHPSVGVFLARRIFAALSASKQGGKAEGESIFQQLMSYRCQHVTDENGDGILLVDALAIALDAPNITRATEELIALGDALFRAPEAKPQGEQK